jgi:CRISPR-associated protein Csm3
MKLKKIRNVKGKIRIITGLHIGASNENIEIGGLDNPIIKDPLPGSNEPYIPGSSLKGKFRSLIEVKEGRYVKDGRFRGQPCDCGKKACPVCAVFGVSAAVRPDDLGPTRIAVRDAHLTNEWQERFKRGELPMEVKYENAINRINGQANPRPLERVPGGVEFDFNIAFKVFENDPEAYFQTLLKAMRLLEMDALGGAGSRGCGQIKFKEITIDDEQKPDDFLYSIDLN